MNDDRDTLFIAQTLDYQKHCATYIEQFTTRDELPTALNTAVACTSKCLIPALATAASFYPDDVGMEHFVDEALAIVKKTTMVQAKKGRDFLKNHDDGAN